MRKKLGFVGGVLAGVAFVACGSTGQDVMRDMAIALDLSDSGVVNLDATAGQDALDAMSLLDMQTADAQSGGTMITGDCDKTVVATYTSQTVTYYFAEIDTGKTPSVLTAPSAFMHDRESFGTWGVHGFYCTPSAGISCSGYAVPEPETAVFAGGNFSGSKLVINCGSKTVFSSGSPSPQGSRFRKATVLVP